METSNAVHAPALSLPEAALLRALPKEKGDAPADASRRGLFHKDLGGKDVAVGVGDDAYAHLRPGAQDVRTVAL